MYDEFFAKANELMQQGISFATATVVHAEKPTSGKPGDKAIITPDGVMYGWIGGSCAQPSVIRESLTALATDECRLIRLSANPEEKPPRAGLINLPMTCFSGGTLEILIEPQHPRPRLIVVGNLPVAQALVHLGKAMNYHVLAVDLDNAHGGMSHADEILTRLDDVAEQIQKNTYVVVTTHGNYDELALEKILRARPIYVGLVASPKRAQAVREYLKIVGLTESEMLPLKSPAGLDIQARRGDEIALSIMAEIVQKRRSARLSNAMTAADDLEVVRHHDEGMEISPDDKSSGVMAVDPICGMQVDKASAKYSYDYGGESYYFCSAGCEAKFIQNPEQYQAAEAPTGEAVDPVCQMTVEISTAKYMSEYEGRLVYFCSAGCKREFDQDPVAYVDQLHLR